MKKLIMVAMMLLMIPLAFGADVTGLQKEQPAAVPQLQGPVSPRLLPARIPGSANGRSMLLFAQTATGYYTLDACQWDSVLNFEAECADNFNVPYAAFVDSLVWWGGYWNGSPVPPIDFWIKIYADSSSQPQQLPTYVERIPYTETDVGGYYLYTGLISPFSASPGGDYWVEFEPTLIFPPQWGNNCSWPGNTPGWGDGQQMYFKSAYFGYPQWVPAYTVFSNYAETSFEIYGFPSVTSYIWDFETGHQGWTHTNGVAFPGGWDVRISTLHSTWACPSPGDSSHWIDSDAYGSTTIYDTAYSPVVMTPVNMYKLKYGYSFYWYSGGNNEKLAVGLRAKVGGTWQAPVELKSWSGASSGPAWDSIDVSGYASAESIRVYFSYTNASYEWYAAFDNVELIGAIGLQHDARALAISAPPATVFPNTSHAPIASYRNSGMNSETFDCRFIIDSAGVEVYNNAINVSLAAGAETTLTFPNWIAGPGDGITYDLYAVSVLAGDLNPANDTVAGQTITTIVSNWIQCADMPSAELAHGTGYDPDNDKIYTICGTPDGGYTYTNFVYQYDPLTDTWATMANAPYAIDWIDASYVNGKIYCFGGFDGGSAYNYNMIYDVAGNSWTTGTAMPLGRMCGGQVIYNDSLVYMLGGSTSSAPTNNVQIYNTYTNAWTTGTALPANFQMGGVAMTGDTIWIVGGYNGSSAWANLVMGIINPSVNETITWTTGTALPIPNAIEGATQLNRNGQWYIYMVGGFENVAYPAVAKAWEYNTVTQTWTALPDYPFPVARNDYLVGREGFNEIYVCGGDDNGDWTGTAQAWKLQWMMPGVTEKPDQGGAVAAFGFAPNMSSLTNGYTPISWTITANTGVSLKVYDGTGRLIRTLVDSPSEPAGNRITYWDGKDNSQRSVSEGIYFVRLEAQGKTASTKLVVIK